ncbi:MAG: hypothetical protein KJ804_22500 [Proteobacteria bacterium]|nr:hypothetical protein [Pseudomonadota bacterium]MBU1061081.1 hypothetical protein [Pseudomonadota bacterium]
MQMNRRAGKRQSTMGLLSSLWDGKYACIGVIEDVSSTGIRVSQVPSYFDEYSQECLTVVHGPFRDFKVILQPSWKLETRKEMYQLIGFQVVTETVSWKQFAAVILKTSQYQEDVFTWYLLRDS